MKTTKTIMAIVAIALFSLIFSSCGGKMSIHSYHEKVISAFNTASKKMATEREVIYENKLSNDENVKLVEGLKKSMDDCTKMMNGLNYPAEAEAFHQQMLEIYNFETETMIPLLSKIVELEPKSSEWYSVWREFDKQNKTVDQMLKKLGQLQSDLQKQAQKK